MTDVSAGDDNAAPADASAAPEQSLEDILAEFEASAPAAESESEASAPEAAPPTTQGEPLDAKKLDELHAWTLQHDRERQVERAQADVASAVTWAREQLSDISVPLADETIRGLLVDRYHSDRNFASAFDRRDANPGAFRGAMERAVKDLREKLRHEPDPEATADHELIAAAVRASTTKAPAPEKPASYSHLSNDDFRAEVRSRYGFNPNI